MTESERALVWLCASPEIPVGERVKLLRAAGDPANLFDGEIGGSRKEKEEKTEKLLSSLERQGMFAVTALSDDYPEGLAHIPDPPLVIYGAGNRSLLQKRKFCVVGSRMTPPWAAKLCEKITSDLSEKFAVVTGLAEGGDSAAIAGALPSGNLISVLPCGLAKCYPAAHASLKEKVKRAGLLLSELLPEETAKKYSFHARNRLLAGLAEGVLVVSAPKKSGALITANFALDCGRDVFAFPHNAGAAYGEGCNELIKRGAYAVTETDDIFAVYGFEPPVKGETAEGDEGRVYAYLRRTGEAHLAAIAEGVGMRIFEASAALSALEIKGLVVKSGGNRFAPVKA